MTKDPNYDKEKMYLHFYFYGNDPIQMVTGDTHRHFSEIKDSGPDRKKGDDKLYSLIRDIRGDRMKDVANSCSIHFNDVRRLESNDIISVKTIEQYCRVCIYYREKVERLLYCVDDVDIEYKIRKYSYKHKTSFYQGCKYYLKKELKK